MLIVLEPGQALGDHQVKENALASPSSTGRSGSRRAASASRPAPGMLFRFEPDERHSVSSADGARILLLLAPWPGEGHYRGSAA